MELSPAEKQIREWLEKDEARQVLAKRASWARDEMKTKAIPFSFLKLPASSPNFEIDEAIRSELAIFILENRAQICEKIAPPEIDRGRVLGHYFIKYLMDKARSSADQGGFRYVYKRFRDILDKEASFHVEPRGGGEWSVFSRQADSREIGSLAKEDLDAVEWPPNLPYTGDRKDIQSKTNLLHLAGWFWDEIVRIGCSGQPSWIHLRNLVEWVDCFVPLSAAKTVSFGEEATLESPASLESKEAKLIRDEDTYFDPAAVGQWAESFANRLNDKQGLVFLLYYDEDLTLEEIAQRMGLRSASAIKYHLEHAAAALREFSEEQRWLSPHGSEPANDLARLFFKETLLEILKNRSKKP